MGNEELSWQLDHSGLFSVYIPSCPVSPLRPSASPLSLLPLLPSPLLSLLLFFSARLLLSLPFPSLTISLREPVGLSACLSALAIDDIFQVVMSSIDLPDWSLAAINEVAKTNVWEALIYGLKFIIETLNLCKDISQLDVEMSILNSKKLDKRFSEYTEYEQAVLVEQEMKHLQLVERRSLVEFNRSLNTAVDDRLMEFISDITPTKTVSSVQHLLNICSQTVIRALESSPPDMASTAKIFLNRVIPDELRSYLWSSALKLSKTPIETSSFPRLSPSLDVLLARRCHLLLDSHYPHLASRAAAALLKTTIVDFMRHNGCPLPHDDDASCSVGEYHEYYDDDATNIFDRLFFLSVPLSCVFPGPGWVSSRPTKEDAVCEGELSNETEQGDLTDKRLPSPPSLLLSKPHMMLQMALQTLVDVRHLGLLLTSTDVNDASLLVKKPIRPVTPDQTWENGYAAKPSSEILRMYSPLLSVTKALVLKKNPALHEHILDMVSTDLNSLKTVADKHHDAVNVGSPRHVKKHLVGNDRVVSFFYDVFVNECLLRGLSGLLPMDTTQFVWDQCFVIGFSKMLPVVMCSMILGCSREVMSLTHTSAAVDSFSSFCRHSSVETIQRLLTDHAAPELHDLFSVEGLYVLDNDEKTDNLLRAVYMKMRPNDLAEPDENSGTTCKPSDSTETERNVVDSMVSGSGPIDKVEAQRLDGITADVKPHSLEDNRRSSTTPESNDKLNDDVVIDNMTDMTDRKDDPSIGNTPG